MSPFTSYAHRHLAAGFVRRGGRVFQLPSLDRVSWRFNAHPDGSGTDWEEDVDVDQPHGLDYRYINHVAKAYRKRNDKEHQPIGDGTAGGEHVPGYCQVLRQVDSTADVSAACDATLFQANGIVHASGHQTLWCVTGPAGDPTICLIDPDRQCKGGDITWTGAQQFDASVDMTVLHVDGSATFTGPVRFEGSAAIAGFDGSVDFTTAAFDGTADFGKRTDFTSIGVVGDSTITGALELDGPVQIDGSSQINGPMSFGANNVYDSSFFDCSIGGQYTKTHDLSSTAVQFTVQFKDVGNGLGMGAGRIYQIPPNYNDDQNVARGPSINNITTTQVTVQAGNSMAGFAWNAAGAIVNCTTGQYRVIGTRLV